MKNTKKSNIIATLLLTSSLASADFQWGASTPILGPDDPSNASESSFTTPLQNSTNPFAPAGGFLAQLIRVNGAKDTAVANGTTGVTDDVVIAASWIGTTGVAGQFSSLIYNGNSDGDYYVRAWAGESLSAAGDYTDGSATIPPLFAGTDHLWYGDSAVFANGAAAVGLPPTTNFGSTPDGGADLNNPIFVNQLLSIVPEPGTLGLFGLGAVLLFNMQRRKRNAKS